MIHVCYGLHDRDGRYSKFTGTSILSMLENYNAPHPRSLTIYILHDNTLTADNMQKFVYMAGQYNQIVKFYNVEQICADKITEIEREFSKERGELWFRFTIGCMYRLFIMDLLPLHVNKAIYLDSDTVVHFDIREFWQVDLGDKPLGVVNAADLGISAQRLISEVPICGEGVIKTEDYFSSGILLMNLDVLRNEKENLHKAFKLVAETPQFNMPDQDILNYCFATRALKLPNKFNKPVGTTDYLERVLYHYNGGLSVRRDNIFDRLFYHYFLKTPWCNEDTFFNLCDITKSIYAGEKNFAIQVSAMLSGKERAFFVSPPNVDAVKSIFHVNTNEEYIVADSPMSVQKMIQSLREASGRKLFFILASDYLALRQLLLQNAFIEGRDFLNGMNFLSDAHGVPMNAGLLVRYM